MSRNETLFDDNSFEDRTTEDIVSASTNIYREVLPLDRLKNLEEKISVAVERVKALKEEKTVLERKIHDLEMALNEKNQEIAALRSEKSTIGSQLEELLSELETIEL